MNTRSSSSSRRGRALKAGASSRRFLQAAVVSDPASVSIRSDYAYVIAEGRAFTEGASETVAALPDDRKAYLGF